MSAAAATPSKRGAVAEEELEKENGKLKTVNAELIVENEALKEENARLRALLSLTFEDASSSFSIETEELAPSEYSQHHDELPLLEPVRVHNCAVCKQEVRSRGECRSERLAHIAMHEQIRISCPMAGCNKHFLLNNLYHHLESIHKKQSKSLAPDERRRHKSNLAKLNVTAENWTAKYFPDEGSLLMVTRPKQLSSTYCKICGLNPTNRNTHVAAHAGLTLQCPIDGCEAVMNPSAVGNHLRRVHILSKATMSVAERNRFNAALTEWQARVDSAFGFYFS